MDTPKAWLPLRHQHVQRLITLCTSRQCRLMKIIMCHVFRDASFSVSRSSALLLVERACSLAGRLVKPSPALVVVAMLRCCGQAGAAVIKQKQKRSASMGGSQTLYVGGVSAVIVEKEAGQGSAAGISIFARSLQPKAARVKAQLLQPS